MIASSREALQRTRVRALGACETSPDRVTRELAANLISTHFGAANQWVRWSDLGWVELFRNRGSPRLLPGHRIWRLQRVIPDSDPEARQADELVPLLARLLDLGCELLGSDFVETLEAAHCHL